VYTRKTEVRKVLAEKEQLKEEITSERDITQENPYPGEEAIEEEKDTTEGVRDKAVKPSGQESTDGTDGEGPARGETPGPSQATESKEEDEELNRVRVVDKRLAELTKEKEGLFQSYIRLKADFDNYRRRTREELSKAKEQGIEDLMIKLLPVLDNLERAIDSSGDPHKWREGVEMVLRQFLGVLESEGLTAIAGPGEEFDPNKHEAIAREPSEQPENIIIEEIRKGYQLKGKTIRATLVKVSAGQYG
jgi:molecular chaperone GrpE